MAEFGAFFVLRNGAISVRTEEASIGKDVLLKLFAWLEEVSKSWSLDTYVFVVVLTEVRRPRCHGASTVGN